MYKAVPKIFMYNKKMKKQEYKFFVLKTLPMYLSYHIAIKYMYNIVYCKKFYAKSFSQNICIISGRSRSVYRKFCISRIMVRYFGGHGFYNGLIKSSW